MTSGLAELVEEESAATRQVSGVVPARAPARVGGPAGRAFTGFTRLQHGHEQELATSLRTVGTTINTNADIAFSELRTVHFCRWVIVHDTAGAAWLAFESNHDGAVEDHLAELVRHGARGVHEIYRHCVGYPLAEAGAIEESQSTLVASFLQQQAIPHAAFHVGAHGCTAERIRREAAIREVVQQFADDQRTSRSWAASTPEQMYDAIISEVAGRGLLGDALARPSAALGDALARPSAALGDALARPSPPLARGPVRYFVYAAALLALLPLSPIAVALLLKLRACETQDLEDDVVIEPLGTRELADREDYQVQNQLTHVVDVKAGLFRQCVLRAVLWLIDLLARYEFDQGSLGGITSFHFARWAFIDGGKRLLFFSNYDGSWESYLGDFIDKAAAGLTAVWSTRSDFRARATSCGRARPTRSASNRGPERARCQRSSGTARTPISRCSTISTTPGCVRGSRNGPRRLRPCAHGCCCSKSGGEDARRRARRTRLIPVLTATPSRTVSMTTLETDDIQAIVFTGYPKNPFAVYLLLEITDAPRARAWLASIAGSVTTGESRLYEVTRNVAFTARGLRALGLSEAALAAFSGEFREGMAGGEHRSRILGDTDESAPDQWEWGGACSPIHVMWMLFAPDERSLTHEIERCRAGYAGALREVFVRDTVTLPDRREHFGFADGIAQPTIAGSYGEKPGVHCIKTGEFVLGYENEYGRTPVSPSVPRTLDVARHLTRVPGACERAIRERDLGRNGSYLVVRQLEQRVAEFWDAMASHSRDPSGNLDDREAIRLAAKCVGRWPSGAPLVATPDRDDPTLAQSNEFMYAKADPAGLACPIGSHIRRTNPRDSLEPGPDESLRVVDRHRILRRGRSYGKPLERFARDREPTARGLFFVCVNANIRRQFEFIQQTWSNNAKFGGLYDDEDPLTGDQPAEGGTFTIPGAPVRRRLQKLSRFVRTRGGEYFFLPSVRAIRFLGALDTVTTHRTSDAVLASERA